MNFTVFLALILAISTGCNCIDFESTLGHITKNSRRDSEGQANAVRDLIKRIIPERAENFEVVVDPSRAMDEKDFFSLKSSDNGTVNILATTGVAAASGFNYYLKYFCNCQVSWITEQLNLPDKLPPVDIEIKFNDRFRYYQNVCTTSYSFVWWTWQQWEAHIDWMVMNSFNLVLAFNGQEAIWAQVYKELGLSQDDMDDYFTGPAFLSWLRMGNVRKWGGPLYQSWHERSLVLQKQIVSRLRSFGVITVLPAFAGHLPRAFKRLYPEADMVKLGSWNNFNDSYCCPYFLNPTEELFQKIGKIFIEKQIAEYGTDNVYSCDSFNENTPPSTDLNYLANVSSSVYKAMTVADPNAVWLMQNWLFVHDAAYWTKDRARALLTAVPKGKMIILDLQSEQFPLYSWLDQYFGQPFIWCMLHNFGGTLGVYGSSDIINERPVEARMLNNSTMIGTGLTMEGIHQNYIIYELMTEAAWRSKPANLSKWFGDYSVRRYGSKNPVAIRALQKLQTWYDTKDVLFTIADFLDAHYSMPVINYGFFHDYIDMIRQIHQTMFDIVYDDMRGAFKTKNIVSFKSAKDSCIFLLTNVEQFLLMDDAFSLDEWIKFARNAGTTTEEKDLYEYNARNQITLWGPRGEIMNYAIKQWSGVFRNFLLPRWKLFLDYSEDVLVKNGTFNDTYIKQKMFETVEEPFTFQKTEIFRKPNAGKIPDLTGIKREKWWKFIETYGRMNKKKRNNMYKLDWTIIDDIFDKSSFSEDDIEVRMVKK